MKSAYKYPMLMTLEGINDFNPNLTYYAQDFAVMSGWGVFDFLRPSKLKNTAGIIAAGATAASAIPGVNAITAPLAVGAGAVAGGAAFIHSTYDKGGSGSPPSTGTGYQPVGPNPGMSPEVKKPSLAMPLIVGAIGLIAALGIAS